MDRNPYAPPQSAVHDHQPPPEAGELASRWARLGGSVLDGLTISVVISPVLYFTGYWQRAFAGTVSPSETFGVTIASFALFCIVNGYLLATGGQTVGKRIVGTRIASATDGRVPTLGTLLGMRYGLTYLVSAIPVVGSFFVLIDTLLVFRADRRCVHDLIAGTKVVKA